MKDLKKIFLITYVSSDIQIEINGKKGHRENKTIGSEMTRRYNKKTR